MIRFEEALAIAAEHSWMLGKERVHLLESTGRVLAEEVFSDINMPPFNRSAVDGFACRRQDLGQDLTIIETIRAGQSPSHSLASGQCSRIMTGSPVPEGADCVIMVEETEEVQSDKIRFTGNRTKNNISLFAEDVKKGDLVISSGTMIQPQHIAIMAAVGQVDPLVSARPRVAVIATGDEIVEPGQTPGISQIRNSNGYQLVEQVRKAGGVPDYLGIAADNEKDTLDRILLAMERNDVVLLTGGVSMGTFDFVPAVMEKAGISILFRKIALQPGRPTIFGKKENICVFGLPGNPVSSFTLFEVLVKPTLWKMMGMGEFYKVLRFPMGVDYERKRNDRMQWIPVSLRDGKVYPLEYHGSAHIFSLATADGLAAIPFGTTKMSAGDLIDVRPI